MDIESICGGGVQIKQHENSYLLTQKTHFENKGESLTERVASFSNALRVRAVRRQGKTRSVFRNLGYLYFFVR